MNRAIRNINCVKKSYNKMEIYIQIIYFLMGLASCVLDYFMVTAFHPDYHQDTYRFMAEYAEIAEFVIYLMYLAIGIFAEMGGIHNKKSKTAWMNGVTTFFVIGAIATVARIHSFLMLSIHIHPGKLDFMGVFVVLMILYQLLKFSMLIAYSTGVHDRINSFNPPNEEFAFVQVQRPQFAISPQ